MTAVISAPGWPSLSRSGADQYVDHHPSARAEVDQPPVMPCGGATPGGAFAKRPAYDHIGRRGLVALARINDNVRRSLACRPGPTDADNQRG